MKLKEIQNIVDEVYPKIEKHYGLSKFFPECTPYIEYETSIYGRLSGEEDDGTFGEQTPHAEFDRMDSFKTKLCKKFKCWFTNTNIIYNHHLG